MQLFIWMQSTIMCEVIVKRAVYIALGVNMDGKKEVLECMWVIMKVLNFGFLSSMG